MIADNLIEIISRCVHFYPPHKIRSQKLGNVKLTGGLGVHSVFFIRNLLKFYHKSFLIFCQNYDKSNVIKTKELTYDVQLSTIL